MINSVEKEIKSNFKVSVAICALLFYLPITGVVNIIFNFFTPLGFTYDTIVCYLVAMIFVIRGIFTYNKNNSKLIIISIFILVTLLFSTLIFFPQNTQYMFTEFTDVIYNPIYRLLIFSFPCFILVVKLTNINIFIEVFKKFVYIVVIALLFKFFLFPQSFNEGGNYMVFSYDLLVPTCFLYYYFFSNKSKAAFGLAIVSSIAIFISGARGALICLGVSVILLLIFNFKNKTKKLLPFIILGSILVVVISMNFRSILIVTDQVLRENNIESRTISKILTDDFLNNSGRDEITNVLLDSISNNKLSGVGMFGDRYITAINGIDNGTYAHNIALELICEYGIILGTFFLLSILYIILKSLLSSKDILQNLIIIFLSSGFVKLFFSGSYLIEPFFYALIGFCVITIQNKKQLEGWDENANSMASKYNITSNSTKFINKL